MYSYCRARVGDIEGLEEENREAAVDFLHASSECQHVSMHNVNFNRNAYSVISLWHWFSPLLAGVILHFNLPVLVDYYIIDPQRWFDLCALVISPSNVSKLIRSANRMERGQRAVQLHNIHCKKVF